MLGLTLAVAAIAGWRWIQSSGGTVAGRPAYLVGAYYYTWYYPGHWASNNYVGRQLADPLEPLLGEYLSDDQAVIRNHLKWASDYGIDFLIISWSRAGSFADLTARNHLLPALGASNVRQVPVVELLSYGERDLSDAAFRSRLATDLQYVGEHYLKHPSVLRVEGRPVLFLYVTRALSGDMAAWIDEVRRMYAAMKLEPYIVADEAFWQEADPDRLRAFDAVTAYNVYDWPRAANAGFAESSTFLADVEGLFSRWQAAARVAGVRFVPNAMPGYNDRGVRLGEDHYVIPRRLGPGSAPASLFARSIELAQRFADPDLPMVTITSFNEWHEWTQVEPARRAGKSPSSNVSPYTQDFPHDAYTFEYLEVVRDRLGDVSRERAATTQ